jgi:hypothetical protein
VSAQLKEVTITGAVGTDVTIYPREHGDPPPPSVFEGAINSKGRLKLLLPPAYFAVVSSSGGALPLKLEEQGPDSVAIQLPGGQA